MKVRVTKDSIYRSKSLFTPKYFLLQSKLISSFLLFLAKEIWILIKNVSKFSVENSITFAYNCCYLDGKNILLNKNFVCLIIRISFIFLFKDAFESNYDQKIFKMARLEKKNSHRQFLSKYYVIDHFMQYILNGNVLHSSWFYILHFLHNISIVLP